LVDEGGGVAPVSATISTVSLGDGGGGFLPAVFNGEEVAVGAPALNAAVVVAAVPVVAVFDGDSTEVEDSSSISASRLRGGSFLVLLPRNIFHKVS
jgi:hypothetical protein